MICSVPLASLFELYFIKGSYCDIGGVYWHGVRLLFWIPPVLFTGFLSCLTVSKTRRFGLLGYFSVSFAMLFGSAILVGPLRGGAGLYRLFGYPRSLILSGFLGLLAGAWLGWNFATRLKRASVRISKQLGIAVQGTASVLMFMVAYLPLAIFVDSLGGGSGQNDFFPGITNVLFWSVIDPWFSYFARFFRTSSSYQLISVAFWILAICCLLDISRRYFRAVRLGSRKKLVGMTVASALFMVASAFVFLFVPEGEVRRHIETVGSSFATYGFELSVSGGNTHESYPALMFEGDAATISENRDINVKNDPPFRLISISPNGETEIELISSGARVRSKPGRPLACKEYGREGLWVDEASYIRQRARFSRYVCKDKEVRSLVGL